MGEYKLILKSPTLKMESEEINVSKTWSVKDLKEHFSISIENCPESKDQRLIYGGKLLKDQDALAVYFRDDIQQHIVHIVIPKKNIEQSNLDCSSDEMNEVKQAYMKYLYDFYTNGESNAWQSELMNQFMRNQQNYMNPSINPSSVLAPSNNENIEPRQAPNRLGVIGFLNRAVRNVWENRPVEADENDLMMVVDEDRRGIARLDIIDLLFLGFRMFVMGTLFYLYSSFYKFSIIFLVVMALFLYRRIRVNNNNRDVNRVINILQQGNEANVEGENAPEVQPSGNESEANGEEGSPEGNVTETSERLLENRLDNAGLDNISLYDRVRSGATFMMTFVYTLLISLIPDHVPDNL